MYIYYKINLSFHQKFTEKIYTVSQMVEGGTFCPKILYFGDEEGGYKPHKKILKPTKNHF